MREDRKTHVAIDVLHRERGRAAQPERRPERRALHPRALARARAVLSRLLLFLPIGHQSGAERDPFALGQLDVDLRGRALPLLLILLAAEDGRDGVARLTLPALEDVRAELEPLLELELELVRVARERRERRRRPLALVLVGVRLLARERRARRGDGDLVGDVREEREDGDVWDRELHGRECGHGDDMSCSSHAIDGVSDTDAPRRAL